MVSLDASGATRWVRVFGAALSDRADDVAIDADTGDAIVVGTSGGPITLDGGAAIAKAGAFVVRWNAKGVATSAIGYPISTMGGAHGAHAVASAGGVVAVGGDYQGTIDLGAGPVSHFFPNGSTPFLVGTAKGSAWSVDFNPTLFYLGGVGKLAIAPNGDVWVVGGFAAAGGGGGFCPGPTPLLRVHDGSIVASLPATAGCDMPKSAWLADVAIRHDGSAAVVGAYAFNGSGPTATLGSLVLPADSGGAVFTAHFSGIAPSDVRVFPASAALGLPVGIAVDAADAVWIAGVTVASEGPQIVHGMLQRSRREHPEASP